MWYMSGGMSSIVIVALMVSVVCVTNPRPAGGSPPVRAVATFELPEVASPYPRFTFKYSLEYAFRGVDMFAVRLGRPTSAEPEIEIRFTPSNATSVTEAAEQHHFAQLPRTRVVAGYQAVGVKIDRGKQGWLILTDPHPIDDKPGSERVRWMFTLPDEELVVSSFAFTR
jgi:hypothetical protein